MKKKKKKEKNIEKKLKKKKKRELKNFMKWLINIKKMVMKMRRRRIIKES